jgi:preprotein translocase subunit SecF
MYKNFNLTESEKEQILNMHKEHGYKKPLKEDDSQQMAMLQQATQEFNEKAEEDLTPDELQEVACSDPDTMEAPQESTSEQKQKLEEFKSKVKTASIDELKQVKKQLRELKKQEQNEQVAGPAVITLLGVSMPPAFAMVIGGIMLIIVLNFLLRLINIRLVKTITSWCTGRQTTGYGLRFGRRD